MSKNWLCHACLLQKDLNLDKLRHAVLTGDTVTIAEEQERLIREKLCEDSPHVAHLRVYPEEYKRLVKDFVQDCQPYTISKLWEYI